MSRRITGCLTIALACLFASEGIAQQIPAEQDFWQAFHFSYYRNKLWPTPFTAQDTTAVLRVFDAQRNIGWRLNNTIGTSMYDAETNGLTEAGRAHLKWILTKAPQNRRVVFVLQADNQSMTAARVESTQLAISEMIPVGPLPQLYLTDEDSPGSSGVYQTAINRALTSSVPAPRLPALNGGATASP